MADAKNTNRLSAPQCRERAGECRAQAATTQQPEHRRMLEQMADSWEDLARDIERRAGRG